jgi:signal transduction histidine kinase
VTGPGGEELGRVVLMADEGELSRLKEELAKQERLARLGGIASGLAHEIRNPLGAIKGLTQHLINKISGEDEREALQVILNSVERLARTITDFQSFANPAIKSERVELTEFMARLHHEMESRNQGLTMEMQFPKEPLTILADPGQLYEALKSLYQNAIQAMEANPPERAGELMATLKRSAASQAMITLSDNGPGFGLDQLKTPFVPYFSSSAKHTGLGLAKANSVIQAFSGSVTLANNPGGGGAIVTVTLPLEDVGLGELRITQIESGKFLTEIHSFMSYDSKFNNVTLTLDLPPLCPVIEADRDLLTQAFTNIYLNAIQAMQATDSGTPQPGGQLDVKLTTPNPESILITFCDNGPGFTQSQLEKPFVPFFTTKSKGMGLGMSIIHRMIEAHHGEVKLENGVSGGGKVSLKLPLKQKSSS